MMAEAYLQVISVVLGVVLCTAAFFKAAAQITKRVDDLTYALQGIREDLNHVMERLTAAEYKYVRIENCSRYQQGDCPLAAAKERKDDVSIDPD
jgi:hypothetical protein